MLCVWFYPALTTVVFCALPLLLLYDVQLKTDSRLVVRTLLAASTVRLDASTATIVTHPAAEQRLLVGLNPNLVFHPLDAMIAKRLPKLLAFATLDPHRRHPL